MIRKSYAAIIVIVVALTSFWLGTLMNEINGKRDGEPSVNSHSVTPTR